MPYATRTIDANAQWTSPVVITQVDRHSLDGHFNASVQGTFDGTLAIQRKIGDSEWETVRSVTAPFAGRDFEPDFRGGLAQWRIGSTAWTSGSAVVKIGRQ